MDSIKMTSFQFGIFGFLGLVVFQTLWWRFLKIWKGEIPLMIGWMFLIFLLFPLVIFFVSRELAGSLLLLSFSLSYLFGFPAVVARSPSLEILRLVQRSMRHGGLSKEELIMNLAKADLIQDRMRDLASDRMIRQQNGKIEVRLFGRVVAAFFYYYRKILGLPPGTG